MIISGKELSARLKAEMAEQVKTCSEEAFASLTLENLLERV